MGYRIFRIDGDRRGAEVTSPPLDSICSVIMLPRERL